jgi:hypothetical protein
VPIIADTKHLGEVNRFIRRHWQRALRVRERVRFREETFHLVLAGGVGVIGGLVNLAAHFATEATKYFFLRSPGTRWKSRR